MMFFLTLLRIFIAPSNMPAFLQRNVTICAIKSPFALLATFSAHTAESLLKIIPELQGLPRADRATPIYI